MSGIAIARASHSHARRAATWVGVLRSRLGAHRLRLMVMAQLVALAVLASRDAGWLQAPELAAYDALVVLLAGHAASDHVLLVTATDQDIARFGWPLRDADLAAVLHRLSRWHARVIGVDLYRDGPLPPGSDALDAEVSGNRDILWVYKLPDEANDGVAPPPALAKTPRAVLADIVTDAGSVVRRGLLAATDPRTGRTVRTLGLALAERFTGASLHRRDSGVAIGETRVPIVAERGGPYASIDASGYQMLLDFRGGTGRFRQVSLADLLDSGEGADGLASLVAGRAVIVGTDALSVRDTFTTPFSTASSDAGPQSGVALHAQLADQLIRMQRAESTARRALPWRIDSLLIWACAMAGMIAHAQLTSARLAVIVGTAGLGSLAAADFAAFGAGLILPGVPCVVAFIASASLTQAILQAVARRERRHIEAAFAHYLDPRIIREIVASDALPQLNGESREISVLFTDIAGFTSFAETMPAQQLASLMVAYFDGACAAAMREGGLVSTFTGDGMMCLFGAPHVQPDHPERAVRAAIAIDAFAEAFSAAQRTAGVAFGATRIGVHTGHAVVGNIGTSSRLTYGALGDVLNTAARIEGLNKTLGTRICVSQDTASRCRDIRFQRLGEFVVKGRRTPTAVVTPVEAGTSADLLARYEAAYQAVRDGFDTADGLFEALAACMPDDPAIAFHQRRLAAGERGIRLVMEEK